MLCIKLLFDNSVESEKEGRTDAIYIFKNEIDEFFSKVSTNRFLYIYSQMYTYILCV